MKNLTLSFAFVGLSLLVVGLSFGQQSDADQKDTVYSGPQVSEKLPEFEMRQVLGDESGTTINVVKESKDGPIVLIFFHERSRPAFGLMRTIAKYGASKKPAELMTAVCFLTKDPTETTDWINRVTQHLPKGVVYGVYQDGLEGPGAYGLNRNVALTVLVGDQGKVVHNSALVQPSLETDGKKILRALVDVTGGGDLPDIRQLSGQSRMARGAPGREPNMRPWLSPVIKKDATDEEVDKAAKALEDHCAKNEAAQKAVGRISNTVVNSGKLENYGTPHAQKYLKKWAKQYRHPIPRTENMKSDDAAKKRGG